MSINLKGLLRTVSIRMVSSISMKQESIREARNMIAAEPLLIQRLAEKLPPHSPEGQRSGVGM